MKCSLGMSNFLEEISSSRHEMQRNEHQDKAHHRDAITKADYKKPQSKWTKSLDKYIAKKKQKQKKMNEKDFPGSPSKTLGFHLQQGQLLSLVGELKTHTPHAMWCDQKINKIAIILKKDEWET